MIQKITCAVNTTDHLLMQQFTDRMLLSGITTKNVKPTSKYIYFDASWDDANVPGIPISSHNRAGAKPRKLTYDGGDATCGLVWKLRREGLSDAEIGLILDASESTIARRRKKHLADGSFVEDSTAVF